MTTGSPISRVRPYGGAADLAKLAGLWPACRPAAWQADFPSPSDLAELLAEPGAAARTRLWEDLAGRVHGYALVDGYGNLWFDCLPELFRASADEIVAWGIGAARDAAGEGAEPASLDTACRAEDGERIALLRRHGFVEQEVRTLRFVRSLAEPIPDPVLPAGYAIRPVAGEAEAGELAALHRAAFGTEHMTIAERLGWMRLPDYDPDLDLVVVTADGRLAAYCFCVIDAAENRLGGRRDGATDPLATHPLHQGRGLARALLAEGMRRLRERGVERAVLGAGSDNVAMQAAARAAGYRVESERAWFSRALRDSA